MAQEERDPVSSAVPAIVARQAANLIGALEQRPIQHQSGWRFAAGRPHCPPGDIPALEVLEHAGSRRGRASEIGTNCRLVGARQGLVRLLHAADRKTRRFQSEGWVLLPGGREISVAAALFATANAFYGCFVG